MDAQKWGLSEYDNTLAFMYSWKLLLGITNTSGEESYYTYHNADFGGYVQK